LKQGKDGETSPTVETLLNPSNLESEPALAPGLLIPTEQQASCHFVSNYVLVPQQGGTRGFLDYIIPLLKTDGPNTHLTNAFDACALASLANRPGAAGSGLEKKALGHYTQALAATHIALKDPEASKSDSTLAAVLLLGLFEVKTPLLFIRKFPILTGPGV
jgi:hypothetical protein